jgi:hypothetical protein
MLLLIAGAGGAAAVSAWMRSRKKTPDDRERERRLRIHEIGRITDGTVIDAQELAGDVDSNSESQLVMYTYDVSGVTYEASQDVTTLRHLVDLHTCRIGLPASIKYDPKAPGNSIVVCEGWTGLRMKKKSSQG